MIITDCSVCSNVQCLNQVSNAPHHICACSYSATLSTDYTCCPSEVMSTEPIAIPSSFAQYSNVNIVVESMVAPDLNVYTCVECPTCMSDCEHWDLNVYFNSNYICYCTPLGCCHCVIGLAKVPASYAGTDIYIGSSGYDSCSNYNKIRVNLIPEV